MSRVQEVLGVAGLGLVAAIHLVPLSGTFARAPGLGVVDVVVITASIVAIVLLWTGQLRGWLLGGVLAASMVVAAVVCVVAQPSAADGVTAWTGLPRDLTALAGVVVGGLALARLRWARTRRVAPTTR